jgi:hypothetical protein
MNSRIVFVGGLTELIVGGEGILLATEDMNLVAFRESMTQCLSIDLGSCAVCGWVAVDYLDDFHADVLEVCEIMLGITFLYGFSKRLKK